MAKPGAAINEQIVPVVRATERGRLVTIAPFRDVPAGNVPVARECRGKAVTAGRASPASDAANRAPAAKAATPSAMTVSRAVNAPMAIADSTALTSRSAHAPNGRATNPRRVRHAWTSDRLR